MASRNRSQSSKETSKKDKKHKDKSVETCKCVDCEERIDDAKENSVECDICSNWFHTKCQKVSDSLFQVLCDSKDDEISWYCSHCRLGAKKLKQQLMHISSRQDEAEKRVKDLEEFQLKINDRVAKLENDKTNLVQNSNTVVSKEEIITTSVREMEQRQERENNAIFFNIEESEEEETLERKQHDIRAVCEICDEELGINIDDSHIMGAIRLGKKIPDKIRPLKILFNQRASKIDVIKNAKKLRESTNVKNQNVFIAPDLTPQQRQEGKLLREERDKLQKDLISSGDRSHQWIIKNNRILKVRLSTTQ